MKSATITLAFYKNQPQFAMGVGQKEAIKKLVFSRLLSKVFEPHNDFKGDFYGANLRKLCHSITSDFIILTFLLPL